MNTRLPVRWKAVRSLDDTGYVPIPWVPSLEALEAIKEGRMEVREVPEPPVRAGAYVYYPGRVWYVKGRVWEVEALFSQGKFVKYGYWVWGPGADYYQIDFFKTRKEALMNTRWMLKVKQWIRKTESRRT